MKIPKLRTKSRKISFEKLPRILGERGFLVFFGLFSISLIFSAFIYYKYYIVIEKETPPLGENTFEFKDKTYQDILKIWQENQLRFENSNIKQYPDPFRILTQ